MRGTAKARIFPLDVGHTFGILQRFLGIARFGVLAALLRTQHAGRSYFQNRAPPDWAALARRNREEGAILLIPPENKLLIDKKTASSLLSISLRSLDYLISCGELKTRRIGRRRLIERRELERFARRDHQTQLPAKGPSDGQ